MAFWEQPRSGFPLNWLILIVIKWFRSF
jgi:hypothetical protein